MYQRPQIAGSSHVLKALPKTIEGATSRYLCCYEKHFKGSTAEMKRLRSYAEAKILMLRRKAPTFYEQKLPTLVNQAASALLTCETSSQAGIIKFNDTHQHFLRVLDELTKSQPAGEVDFQVERDRAKEREILRKRHLFLRERIDQMDAIEFTNDELGDEDSDTKYMKTITEIDRLKAELKRVAILIATMEGEQIEDEVKFVLKVPQRSILERLSKYQLKKLEGIILEFSKQHKQKRTAMYVDKSIIDGMIAKLGIENGKFTKEEMSELAKDALDAYKKYYRDIENERRNEYFETLVTNKHLLPREGIILKSPDDVPEDVKLKLELSEKQYHKQLDEYCEKFSDQIPGDEDNHFVENIDDDRDESDDDRDESDDEQIAIEAIIGQNSHLFARVKEEPRDDYDNNAPSDDEIIVNEDMAERVETTLGKNNVANESGENAFFVDSDSDISDFQDIDNDTKQIVPNGQISNNFNSTKSVISASTSFSNRASQSQGEMYKYPDYEQVADNLDKLFDSMDNDDTPSLSQTGKPVLQMPLQQSSDSRSQGNLADDDFEMLGIIEPTDKIPVIEIDSDEDD